MEAYGKHSGKTLTSQLEAVRLRETGSDPTHKHIYSSTTALDFKQESPDFLSREKTSPLFELMVPF